MGANNGKQYGSEDSEEVGQSSGKGSSSISSDISSSTDHTPTKAPKNVATTEGIVQIFSISCPRSSPFLSTAWKSERKSTKQGSERKKKTSESSLGKELEEEGRCSGNNPASSRQGLSRASRHCEILKRIPIALVYEQTASKSGLTLPVHLSSSLLKSADSFANVSSPSLASLLEAFK
ncbi:hypothetical protein NQZ68_013773 [Dissostichus eleginoides]|nr:hypothetical protein NQZ68_013773 [Dissostichus eleginoides]